jgi:DNA invertase Pin-like site-specific DNA recombinase
MRIGYCRVSTAGQSLDNQLEKLGDCEKVYSEKLSGAKMRPELEQALDFIREGDSLVVTKLDRLARSLSDLCKISELIESKRANLVILDQQIDTSTPTGKLMFNMIGAIAEFERTLINERTKEGQQAAMEKGVKFGAKPKLDDKQKEKLVEMIEAKELTKVEIAEYFGVTRDTVYRLYREMKK